MISVEFTIANAPTITLNSVWDRNHGGRLVCSRPNIRAGGGLSLCTNCTACRKWNHLGRR